MADEITSVGSLAEELEASAKRMPGGLYVDPEFPPGPAALSGIRAADVKWVRVGRREDLLSETPRAAVQGKIGDCWFLSAATLVGRRKALIRKTLVAQSPGRGFYIFSFYKEGSWRLVAVDDLIPFEKGQPLFARSDDSWNPLYQLLEKAYAKIQGGYAALSEGSVAYAFTDLTGNPCETLEVCPSKEGAAANGPALQTCSDWEAIEDALNQDWLVVASIFRPDFPVGQEVVVGGKQTGLYANHAYSIFQTFRSQIKKARLLRLINPWGRKEWRGSWSDDSEEWTAQVVEEFDKDSVEFADDGVFWINWEGFNRYFNKLIICRLYDDAVGARWARKSAEGEWRGRSAGGSQNHASWAFNPRFFLRASSPQAALIFLSQQDVKWAGTAGRRKGEFYSVGLTLVRDSQIVASSAYWGARDVSLPVELSEGVSYAVVPATFEPGQEGAFHLEVFCSGDFALEAGAP